MQNGSISLFIQQHLQPFLFYFMQKVATSSIGQAVLL